MSLFDDTGGYAASAIDQMILSGHSPIAINFSGKSIDPRYQNKRAEMYFLFADWIRGGSLPPSPALKKQLLAQKYMFAGNRMQLIEKDQIKDELGESPDEADAIALTFALPEQPSAPGFEIAPGIRLTMHGIVHSGHNPQMNDWDPHSDEALKKLFE
jgi:hypothetical protein